MTKRILSLLLVVIMAFSSVLLVSCNGEEEESSGTASEVGDTAGFLNEKKDFGGETIKILTYANRNFSTCQIAPEELVDEAVSDAFYERNAIIEENYGIKIEVETEDDQNTIADTIRLNCQSNLDEYQAVVTGIVYMAPLGVEGFLYDFNSIDNGYLHLDKEWWDQTIMQDISINDKIWFLSGDALVEDDESTWAIYFNKELIKSYDLEDPYQLVRDGAWTLDKMHELASKVHKQNGSTKSYDPDVGDVWGLLAQSYDYYAFMLGGDQPMVDNTGDEPRLRVDEEENYNTFYTVYDIMLDDKNTGVADFFGSWNSGVYGQKTQIFANGNALFMPGAISTVSEEVMRNAEIKYGILPMPKRSDLQDDYTTSVTVYWCSVFSIPLSNVEKLDATCYALEAMAFYGKKLVTPEYYDRTLTYKRFQDDESRDMLDLIFRNRTYDLGGIFNFGDTGGGNGTLYFYTNLLGAKSNAIVSEYEKYSGAYQTALDALIEQANKE
ncbi:MAG: extracellular solute-binding protein [Clostridia bacterium]|nr:extracellular solute-binding protein [Clostridia bacterium]